VFIPAVDADLVEDARQRKRVERVVIDDVAYVACLKDHEARYVRIVVVAYTERPSLNQFDGLRRTKVEAMLRPMQVAKRAGPWLIKT
jgi:hypothetical protein